MGGETTIPALSLGGELDPPPNGFLLPQPRISARTFRTPQFFSLQKFASSPILFAILAAGRAPSGSASASAPNHFPERKVAGGQALQIPGGNILFDIFCNLDLAHDKTQIVSTFIQ